VRAAEVSSGCRAAAPRSWSGCARPSTRRATATCRRPPPTRPRPRSCCACGCATCPTRCCPPRPPAGSWFCTQICCRRRGLGPGLGRGRGRGRA
ncbi:Protein of unknown function, partial [Gryllus bimaculatus]